jgi:hypothetical protein
MTTNCNDARAQPPALPGQDHARSTVWRFVSKALKLLLAYIIGVPILVGIVRVITHLIDPERGDDLLMDVIMWTSMALCVLVPIGLASYAVFRLVKWLKGKKSP